MSLPRGCRRVCPRSFGSTRRPRPPKSSTDSINRLAPDSARTACWPDGSSDEIGYYAGENPAQVYDLHATVLRLLGIDHKKLTYYHNGIQRRLTDVHGSVIEGVLA